MLDKNIFCAQDIILSVQDSILCAQVKKESEMSSLRFRTIRYS